MVNNILLFSLAPSQAWLQVVLLIIGIVVVLKGADWLTSGSVGMAERMGVPQIVIGLTIVAIGTSMPEFFVSLISAINGTPDLAVGNIVGSNIFNALLIVGIAAIVAPITILKTTVRQDVPVALLASVLLMIMTLDQHISRLDAAILFVLFIVFIGFTLRGAKNGQNDSSENTPKQFMPMGKAALLIIIGLAALVAGSNLFVDNASSLARSLGVSDAVIGLTIVAGGTSLPELATSTVAAYKGNSGIAIGNVLGSNVFNILMILGITGIITPMTITGITMVDLAMMVLSILLIWLFSFTKYRIERWEGIVLVIIFAGYMWWLL